MSRECLSQSQLPQVCFNLSKSIATVLLSAHVPHRTLQKGYLGPPCSFALAELTIK